MWPANNVIHIGGDEDVKFLEQSKILSRPNVVLSGAFSGPEPFILSQVQTFNDLSADPKSIWDICQNSATLIAAAGGDVVESGGIGMELIKAIPVPDKDVPLNEIMQFKARRSDELCALREELDNLASSVSRAADIEAELRSQLAKVDKACSDVLKISAEWQFPVRLSSTKLALDLKPFEVLAGAVAAVSGLTYLSGVQAALAAVGGATWGAKSAIKITGDIGWKGLKPRKTPFAYVSKFHRELF